MRKLLVTFAAVGLIGLAGCDTAAEEAPVVDPVTEEATAPAVTEPAPPPVVVDSIVADTAAPAAQ